jgi:tetratricopeptide (TPR) repeat protein
MYLSATDSEERTAANQHSLRRLVLSVQAGLHKLNLLIAICDNPRYRDELIRTYEAELIAQGVACFQVRLDRQQPSLKQCLLDWQAHTPNWQPQNPTLLTVNGGDELLGIRLQQAKSAQERFFFSVQWTREGLREFQFPIVLWVSEAIAQGLAQQAPDFWSWRGGVFEFEQPLTLRESDRSLELRPLEATEPGSPLAEPAQLEQQIVALEAEDAHSPLLASLYESLGKTYAQRLEQGIAVYYPQETEKAIAAFQAAIAHRETSQQGSEMSPSDLALLATSLNNLAGLYKSQGRYAEAEPLLERSLSIREQQLGPEHPDVATSLNNLALLYKSQGRYSEAEPLYERSLSIWEQQLGPAHPDVATSLNNLAALYNSQGRYAEAETLYERSLSISEQQLGPVHPDVANSLNNLADLYYSQGRYAEAEPLYLKSLKILSQVIEKSGFENPSFNTVSRNFYSFLRQVIAAGRQTELSNDSRTQELLAQIQTEVRER